MRAEVQLFEKLGTISWNWTEDTNFEISIYNKLWKDNLWSLKKILHFLGVKSEIYLRLKWLNWQFFGDKNGSRPDSEAKHTVRLSDEMINCMYSSFHNDKTSCLN